MHRWIAAIRPEAYCAPSLRREVKRILQSDNGSEAAWQRAATVARPKELTALGDHEPTVSFSDRASVPVVQHTLVYDSLDESLEALYFELLGAFERSDRWQVSKLRDETAPTSGSSLFAEQIRRLQTTQRESQHFLRQAGELVQSILREQPAIERLQQLLHWVQAYQSGEADQRRAALVMLKQAWLEENPRGAAGVGGPRWDPETLSHFFAEEQESEPVKPDTDWRTMLNRQQQESFGRWLEKAEASLRSQLELKRRQLGQQSATLKLLARWLRPYLRSSRSLDPQTPVDAALVNVFNTAVVDLVLVAQDAVPVEEWVAAGEVPKFVIRAARRRPTPVVLVELRLRSAPLRTSGGAHAHRGRMELRLSSYALSSGELAWLRREMERDDLTQLVSALEGALDATVQTVLAAVGETGDKPPITPVQSEDRNPFLVLWDLLRAGWKWLFGERQGRDEGEVSRPDTAAEEFLRRHAALRSALVCESVYGTLKQRLRMPVLDGDAV